MEKYEIKKAEYKNNNLYFYLNQEIKEDWLNILKQGKYDHTSTNGLNTYKLILLKNEIGIYNTIYFSDVQQDKELVSILCRNVEDWIKSTNKLYYDKLNSDK